MFDFKATIDEADHALLEGNYVLAVFDYWLIDFAFYDEEFPISYTKEMGRKARKMFFKILKKHKGEILESDYYREMKESFSVFESYRKYFCHFERVVRSLQDGRRKRIKEPVHVQHEIDWMAELYY